jgi:hypothetical protein
MPAHRVAPSKASTTVKAGHVRSIRHAHHQISYSVPEPLLQASRARVAGEVIAVVKSATVVDAVVMASAASRGDRVLTSDFDDFDRHPRLTQAL